MDVTTPLYPSCDIAGLMRDLWFIRRCFFVFGSSEIWHLVVWSAISDVPYLRETFAPTTHCHYHRLYESSDTCVRFVRNVTSLADTRVVTSYTGCPRRNGQNFGRVFLMLNYTDITQNTYIQSWTVTEIMAWEKCGHISAYCTSTAVSHWPWQCNKSSHLCDCTRSAQRDKTVLHYCQIFMRKLKCLVTLRTTMTWVRVFL